MSVTSIKNLSDDALAVRIANLKNKSKLDEAVREMTLRYKGKLIAFSVSLDLCQADAEHAAQSVLDEKLIPLCRRYDPKNGRFHHFLLCTMRREIRKFREQERTDMRIPANLRASHRRVHKLAADHPLMERRELVNVIAKKFDRSEEYVDFLLSIDEPDTIGQSSHYEDLTVFLDEEGFCTDDRITQEMIGDSISVKRLLREFDRLLTPVEKYVFCRRSGFVDGCDTDCVTILDELLENFGIRYKNPSSVSSLYQSAVRKLRKAYTREDIISRFE